MELKKLRSSETAVELDFWLGLVGMFGIGECYLGNWGRGAGFLAISGVFYALVLRVLVTPSLAFMWGYLPVAGGLALCLQMSDIFQLTDRLAKELDR